MTAEAASNACTHCGAALDSERVYICAACDAVVAEEVAKREARDTAERAYFRMRQSGLPIDYRTGARTIADVAGKIISADALAFGFLLGAEVRGMFLHGPAGSFKTSVAAVFLAKHIRDGKSGRYVFVPDLFSDIHASYQGGGYMTRERIVEPLIITPHLVLDDLGKEKASEHAAGVILEILDGRYRNIVAGDWMIVTSNYDLDALCDRFPSEEFGDPIRRRLSELTVSVPMERLP